MTEEAAAAESSALRKVGRRLVPFLWLMYVAAFLDRTAVGFAATQMNRDLGFSASVYGFGAGLFFIGYCLFEIPSNLLLHRVGGPRWLARIMLSWAVVAGATSLVRDMSSFYALRFLLGVAEAGFFPGVLYYLTHWVPSTRRAPLMAGFMTAIPLSTAVAGPVSTAILALDGTWGIAGWQWLYLIETLPSLGLAAFAVRCLPESPAAARWLNRAEKVALQERLQAEQAGVAHLPLRQSLASPEVWKFCISYFGVEVALYGVIFWIPQIFSHMGVRPALLGWAVAVPYACATVAMVWWARRSDRLRERPRHLLAASVAGFTGLATSALWSDTPALALPAITLGAAGTLAVLPLFWTRPTALLGGAAAAGAIALINAVGNIGGFVGPFLVGALKDATGAFTGGLLLAAAGVLLTGILTMLLSRHPVPLAALDVKP